MAFKCRSCGEAIEWAYTESGRHIPVDPEPVVGGNIALDKSKGRPFVARVIKRGEGSAFRHPSLLPEDAAQQRHISHFATCKDASYWRKSTVESSV